MKGIANLGTKCDKCFTPVFSNGDSIGYEDRWEVISGTVEHLGGASIDTAGQESSKKNVCI